MTQMITRRSVLGVGMAVLGMAGRATAQKKYDTGVTDTEIKLGTTSPYSGPASAYGVYGQARSAYFEMVNDRGGINSRKVNLIFPDNAFSPPKAGEQNPKLLQSHRVVAHPRLFGTPP